jgi:penicillin-binding protein 1A
LQLARAYAVLANGGYLIDPYFIQSIHDATDALVFQAEPRVVCPHCRAATAADKSAAAALPAQAPRVVTPQNAWLMTSMMQDVIQRGTGSKARVLGRTDLAGKTGTTNDQKDAWFSGFNRTLVATAWVGFDRLEPLGRGETGGRAALPVWIDYMRAALAGVPEMSLEQPEGLVTVRIDPVTGLLAESGRADAIFETFVADSAPTRRSDAYTPGGASAGGGSAVDQLF